MTRFVGFAVFGIIATLAVAGFAITRASAHDEEARLLSERATEVAAILSTSGSLTSSLHVIGEVYASGEQSGPAFGAGARSLVAGAVTSVGVAERSGDDVVVRAVEGAGLKVAEVVGGERGQLLRSSLSAKGLASVLIRGDELSTLVVALGRPDGRVVFIESLIASRPAPASADSPFAELDAVLYRTPTADPANLLIATTDQLPLRGRVDSRELAFGSEQWLLQTAAREPLASAQGRAVPWIILAAGIAAALLAGGVIELLTRRRAYALGLVTARTADLRNTMTELAAARTAAETANMAKSQFLSGMSHELRTPLNAVLGFAQVLGLNGLNADDRDAVDHIIKGGNHLLTLINEVLDISRIETGNLALSLEPVLANDVVAEAVELMQPLAAARSIRVVADQRSTDLHYVLADRQRLKQVLLNLLSNAVKYNFSGGTVVVTYEQMSATRLRLKVTDTGPGIAADEVGLLFVPFERLGAKSTDIEGTGIGLALSRRLTEAMGGSLDVESVLGNGSTFWIDLPLVEGAVERYERMSVSSPALEPPSDERHRILYIEDNLSNITLVERILAKRANVEVVPAMQGRLGVELARLHRPALILLDLHLPDISGEEVLHLLRRDPETSAIPVVIVSADATNGQIQRLQAAGATAYLTKPLDVHELLRTISDILATRNAGVQLTR